MKILYNTNFLLINIIKLYINKRQFNQKYSTINFVQLLLIFYKLLLTNNQKKSKNWLSRFQVTFLHANADNDHERLKNQSGVLSLVKIQ